MDGSNIRFVTIKMILSRTRPRSNPNWVIQPRSYPQIIRILTSFLDDRVVPEQSAMMNKTIRDKIAESIKLSKTPVSTKRARELMLHSSGSKTRNGAGGFLKWLHAVDGAKQANESTTVSKFATDIAKGITDMNIGGIDLGNLANKFPDMHLADLGADLGTKIQDLHIAENLQNVGGIVGENLQNVGGQLVDQLKEIDMEENIKKSKKAMSKIGNGLKSMGNTFGSMFGKKKEIEPATPIEQKVHEENLKKSIEMIRQGSMSENPKQLSNIHVRVSTAKLSNPKMSNAKLSNAKLSNAKMSNAKMSNAKMSNAKMSSTQAAGSSMKLP